MDGIPKKGGWVLITRNLPTEIPVHRFAIYYAIPTGVYFFHDERELVNQWKYSTTSFGNIPGDPFLADLCGVFGNIEMVKRAIFHHCRPKANFEFSEKEKEALNTISIEEYEEEYKVAQQVKVRTRFGDVCVQPEEYRIVNNADLESYMENVRKEHAFITYLSKSKQLTGKIADQVFYLRSRGISFGKALELCVGEVKTNNLFYIFMHPGYVQYFTREPELSSYYRKHLRQMIKSKDEDYAAMYLSKIQECEGFGSFEMPELKAEKVVN